MIILRLFPRKIRNKIQEHLPIKWMVSLALWLAAILLGFTIVFKCVEKVSWEESVWQIWQTATTVGYGNKPAETPLGRWATMFFGLASIAFLGTGISAAFDVKAYLRDRRRYGLMSNPVKAGYVVFNFPGSDVFRLFAQEIRSVEKNIGICVVDGRLEELPPSIAMLQNIQFVKGDILSRETYKCASLTNNKAVIIFPADPESPDSDGTTKTVVDLVLRFVGDQTRIIYLLVKAENAWMFDNRATGVWQSLETLLIVQECQDPQSANIIQRLLKNTEGANPQTVKPNRIVGWTWQKFLIKTIETAAWMKISVNPFALIQKGETNTCPALDCEIKDGDLISIISRNGFDWEKFEKQLTTTKPV